VGVVVGGQTGGGPHVPLGNFRCPDSGSFNIKLDIQKCFRVTLYSLVYSADQ